MSRTPAAELPGAQVLIPVKHLAHAKTRLSPALSPAERSALVLAMVEDTVRAALAADGVGSVHVVTPDPGVAATAERLGAAVLPDPEPDDGDAARDALNRALDHAAARVHRADAALVALQADLPALRPGELAAALALSRPHARSLVTDRHRAGTSALIVRGAPAALRPRFGSGSARRHTADGAIALDGSWPGLRCDVDTVADLVETMRLGPGPATARFVESLGGAAALLTMR